MMVSAGSPPPVTRSPEAAGRRGVSRTAAVIIARRAEPTLAWDEHLAAPHQGVHTAWAMGAPSSHGTGPTARSAPSISGDERVPDAGGGQGVGCTAESR